MYTDFLVNEPHCGGLRASISISYSLSNKMWNSKGRVNSLKCLFEHCYWAFSSPPQLRHEVAPGWTQAPSAGILHFRAPWPFHIWNPCHALHFSLLLLAPSLSSGTWATRSRSSAFPSNSYTSFTTCWSPAARWQLSQLKESDRQDAATRPGLCIQTEGLPMTGSYMVLTTLAVDLWNVHACYPHVSDRGAQGKFSPASFSLSDPLDTCPCRAHITITVSLPLHGIAEQPGFKGWSFSWDSERPSSVLRWKEKFSIRDVVLNFSVLTFSTNASVWSLPMFECLASSKWKIPVWAGSKCAADAASDIMLIVMTCHPGPEENGGSLLPRGQSGTSWGQILCGYLKY